MTRSLIEVVVDLMNMFPYKYRVSDILNPPAIVEGGAKVDMGQKNIFFGSYVMVHIGATNTMKSICVPAIALESLNSYGGYYFRIIFTGK